VQIVPSLLSADFACIVRAIREMEDAGATRLHLDVMDGHFVPNITIGPFIIEAIRRVTALHLETHLMIAHPDQFIRQFISAGSNTVIIHVESSHQPIADLAAIRQMGAAAGIVLNPPTAFKAVEPYLPLIDHLLVMTVNPGFGGQAMISSALEKVRRARSFRPDRAFLIEIDGGVNAETLDQAIASGCDLLVAGSAIFSADSPGVRYRELSQRLPQ